MMYKLNMIFHEFKKNRNYYLLKERLKFFCNTYRYQDNPDIGIGYAESYKLVTNMGSIYRLKNHIEDNVNTLFAKQMITLHRKEELIRNCDFARLFIRQRKLPLKSEYLPKSKLIRKLTTLYRNTNYLKCDISVYINKYESNVEALKSLYYKVVVIKV